MIRNGDRLENPVTGEILIFRGTSRDSGGEAVLVETIVRPEGFVGAAHVHPHQTERFEVLEGTPGARVRVADRDDVQARRRGQDEPQRNAESAPARRHRAIAFRHRAPAIPAGLAAAGGARGAAPLGRLLGDRATVVGVAG
jgi:hypothetical protein